MLVPHTHHSEITNRHSLRDAGSVTSCQSRLQPTTIMNPSFRYVCLSILAVSAMMSGCTRVRATTFDPRAEPVRRTEPAAIRFYETQRPRCEFREIGHITAHSRFLAPWSSVVNTARQRASEMGGDAIVAFRESTRISGGTITPSGVGISETTSLSGTVIRFTNPACRE